MKLLKNVCIAAFMFASVTLSMAGNDPTNRETETLQIRKMLINMSGIETLEKGEKVNINFLINARNEIIVLSTTNESFDNAIKTILNYRKVTLSELKMNTVYTLPVVFR